MSTSPSLSMSPRSKLTTAGLLEPGKSGATHETGERNVPPACPKNTSNRRVPMQPITRSARPSPSRSAACTSCGPGVPPDHASTRIRCETAKLAPGPLRTMATCSLP